MLTLLGCVGFMLLSSDTHRKLHECIPGYAFANALPVALTVLTLTLMLTWSTGSPPE